MNAPAGIRHYRRSPFLVLLWMSDELVLLHADTLQRFRVQPAFLTLLSQLGEWSTAQDLSTSGQTIDSDDLEQLHRMGVLEAEDDVTSCADAKFVWDPLELAVQRRTAYGGHWPGQTASNSPPPLRKNLPDCCCIGLPPPAPELPEPLSAVLNRRRTLRTYSERPLRIEELSTLLHHSARIVRIWSHPELGEMALRPFPSAGARSELEVYVVSEDIEGLQAGAWYYDPAGHRLLQIRPRDEHQARLLRSVSDAAGGALNRNPPAVLLITAVFERIMWKYRDLGLKLIYQDAGGLLQTLYLVATALGLAPCAIGGADESANSRWLGLDALRESQVACLLIGPQANAGETEP